MVWGGRNRPLLAFFLLGFVARVSLSIWLPRGSFDMFFVMGALAIGSGYALANRWALMLPVSIMIASDMFLYFFHRGSYPFSSGLLLWISFFMWTGFAMMAYIAVRARRLTIRHPSLLPIFLSTTWGVLLYDLWTNMGWWLGPFYPNTLGGLAACYSAATPFMIWHMISTLSTVPLVYVALWVSNKNKYMFWHESESSMKEPSDG